MLGNRQQVRPIVLLLIQEWAKESLDGLVDALGLTIRLRVESRRHSWSDPQPCQEGLPGCRSEAGIAIGHNVHGETGNRHTSLANIRARSAAVLAPTMSGTKWAVFVYLSIIHTSPHPLDSGSPVMKSIVSKVHDA